MPIFKIDIQKLYVGEYWTNRYLVEATDLLDAQDVGSELVTMERAFHRNTILFDKLRVADNVRDTEVFVTIPLQVAGGAGFDGVQLPLFNVVRVDFTVANSRPLRKYYRTGMTSSEIDSTGLRPTYMALVEQALNNSNAVTRMVDPQGNPAVTGVVSPTIGMRQLRRGTRRRQTPIL